MVRVMVLLLYRMMALDSSVTMATQLKTAPDRMPLPIIGAVTVRKVLSLPAPREMDASSVLMGMDCSVAVAERIV